MSGSQTSSSRANLPIAVDVMGGDRGPNVVIEGAVQAAREHGIASVLVGQKDVIQRELAHYSDAPALPISFHHASEVVEMDDVPSLAVRGKPDSSIRVAFDLVSQGTAAAVVSSGNTGAIMAAGVFVCGTLPGIARPAIASLIPKSSDSIPTVLLDSGANSGCQAYQLVQFALMGKHYAMSGLSCDNPRIALLSNGTEMSKGNDIIRSAAMMLSEIEGLNFVGYVEGRDVAKDVVDVVVCDGFVGNIVLKAMEGTVELVLDSIKRYVEPSVRGKVGMWLSRPILKKVFRERLDPSAYGGAPLLGLSHIAIKCHGSSSSRAIRNGVRVAKKFIDEDLVAKMHVALSNLDSKVAGVDEDGAWSRVGQRLERGRNAEVSPPVKQEVKSSSGGGGGHE